jgi:nucleotide-binding universal stress UspA family protein
MDKQIVVGVDGSAGSFAATRYAAALASRRRATLLLVHGFVDPIGYGGLGFSAYAPALPDPRADGESLLYEAAATVRAEYPYLRVETLPMASGGASALIEQSHGAEAVVVGHRGLGGFAELLLGSVGTQVAAYASGPVIIVRPPATEAADAPIVVGVDGSPQCLPALAFAFEEAVDRALPLLAVNVYPKVDAGSAAEAEAVLKSVVDPLAATHPGVVVRSEVRPGADGEDTFVKASADAALVVVGSRGRGGFKGLLLGSVSQALVHHARCPVAVVHPRTAMNDVRSENAR